VILNLATLRTELGTRLKAPNTISTGQKDLWLNLAQNDLASEVDLGNLRVAETITLVPDQAKYYTAHDYNRVISVTDRTAGRELEYRAAGSVDEADPQATSTGTPLWFYFKGEEYVTAQPVVAGAVSVVSSSSSDTTQKVRIWGKSGGVDTTEVLTLNGLSPVAGTVSWDVNGLYSVAKDGTTSGRVTASRGAATVSVLAPHVTANERHPLYLWPVPADADVVDVLGYRAPRPLVNAEDIPDLPQIFHEAVLVGAVIRGHRALFRFQEAAAIQDGEYVPMVRRLKATQGAPRARKSVVIRGGAYTRDVLVPWGISPFRDPIS
jgi:hypothetical protein